MTHAVSHFHRTSAAADHYPLLGPTSLLHSKQSPLDMDGHHCPDPSLQSSLLLHSTAAWPLQSTRARIANRLNCKDVSKRKEPKAHRKTLSGTKLKSQPTHKHHKQNITLNQGRECPLQATAAWHLGSPKDDPGVTKPGLSVYLVCQEKAMSDTLHHRPYD
jgi:hypothetical protein